MFKLYTNKLYTNNKMNVFFMKNRLSKLKRRREVLDKLIPELEKEIEKGIIENRKRDKEYKKMKKKEKIIK